MPSLSPVYLDTTLALAQIGDMDAMNSMIAMLQEALARDIQRIGAHLQSGDVAAANRLLHPLKGFIPIFCREDFCGRVEAVESMSKDSQSLTVGPAYAALQPALEQLLAEVCAYLEAIGNVS